MLKNNSYQKIYPYFVLARLDKPIGSWLLLLPGWWIICIFENNFLSLLYHMMLFLFGAIIMRSAGCIVNDLLDRDIDSKVQRTKSRPLASKEITVYNAIIFLSILCFFGLLILFQLPKLTWFVGICSAPLILFYPFFKRFTNWPQIILGLTFSWGIPTATSIYYDMIDQSTLISVLQIYIGTFFWIFGYDTIYATQDIKDDLKNNVGSSAIGLRNMIRPCIALIYFLALCFWFSGFFHFLNFYTLILFLLLVFNHLTWQILKFDINDPVSANKIFFSNRNLGLIITAIILIDKLVS